VSTVAERVARGAAWLDEKYPQWFTKIDLSILDLGDCTQCVLGQVYTGVIPAAEQGQVLAQAIRSVTQGWPDAQEWADDYRLQVLSNQMGGYHILTDFHELPEDGQWHGFVATVDSLEVDGGRGEYVELLDEWTRMILSKRMAAHQVDRVLVAA
jgi:hypothetical protein